MYKGNIRSIDDFGSLKINFNNGKADKKVNPYTFIKPPKKSTFSFKTDLHALNILSNVKLGENDKFGLSNVDDLNKIIHNLNSYLDLRDGHVSNINIVAYDCSLALEGGECEEITSESIKEYSEVVRAAIVNQGVPGGHDFIIGKVGRDSQKVYGMMEVDIPIKLEITYSYNPENSEDKFDPEPEEPRSELKKKSKSDDKSDPKPNPGAKILKIIKHRREELEKEVTYLDPTTYRSVTCKASESLYGIWYLKMLDIYEKEVKNNFVAGINEYFLWGIPPKVDCFDPNAFGNLHVPGVKIWLEIALKDRIRYFNDGLDVRVDLDHTNLFYGEFCRRVKKAYDEGIIHIDSWQTGVFMYLASKRIHSRIIHSIETRSRMSEKDWDRTSLGSKFYKEDMDSDAPAKMENIFLNNVSKYL